MVRRRMAVRWWVAFALTGSVSVLAQTTVSTSVSSGSYGTPDSPFTVDVSVSGNEDPSGIVGWSFRIHFNHRAMSVLSVTDLTADPLLTITFNPVEWPSEAAGHGTNVYLILTADSGSYPAAIPSNATLFRLNCVTSASPEYPFSILLRDHGSEPLLSGELVNLAPLRYDMAATTDLVAQGPTATLTDTPNPSLTDTPTSPPTDTPMETDTPVPTATPTDTPTRTPSPTRTATETPRAIPADAITFVSLVPSGGALWPSIGRTHLALHPTRNRLYTIAEAGEGPALVHRDTVTGGVIAAGTVEHAAGQAMDLEVWGRGEQVLVAWGKRQLGSSERLDGVGVGRIDARTGFATAPVGQPDYLVFDIDQARDTAWGITGRRETQAYEITSYDLAGGVAASTDIGLVTPEAIVRDTMLDASRGRLYTLFQRTRHPQSPNVVVPGALILAHDLPDGALRGQVELPAGNYRLGGMALDATREKLYAIPFEPGGHLYQIDTAALVLEATRAEGDFFDGFQVAGSIAVHPESGSVLIANGDETEVARRVVLADVSSATPVVERTWSSGADPSRLLFDERLARVHVASQPSQSVTLIEATRTPELLQAPMAVLPHGLVLDGSNDQILLLSLGGEIYVVSTRDGRLTDRIDSIGLQPDVRLVLDSPRNRFLAGTFEEAPPAVFDSGSLARIGSLPEGGSALAVSAVDGLILQAGPAAASATGERALLIRAATDGTSIGAVPPSVRFSRTQTMALDDARKRVFGLTGDRAGGLGRGVWHYHWPSGASGELAIPAPPAGVWSPLSLLAVDETTGRIAVIGYSAGYHLIRYEAFDDPAPLRTPLAGLANVSDLMIDPDNGLIVILGASSTPEQAWLYLVPVAGTPAISKRLIDVPSPPSRMALDSDRGELWLAGSTPSGLYRIRWPLDEMRVGLRAPSPFDASPFARFTAMGRPGRTELRWSLDPARPGASLLLERQDGELAAFRPLLPAALPSAATAFDDADVLAEVQYRYRLTLFDDGNAAATEVQMATGPAPRDPYKAVARPMTLVSRVVAGGTAAQQVIVEGRTLLFRYARATLPPAPWLAAAGLSVTLAQERIAVPGVFTLQLAADAGAVAGEYAIPVEIAVDGEVQVVWLFTTALIPFADSFADLPPYPAHSRRIGIHTDSLLREADGNLLVVKGELNAPRGNLGGTGIVARVDAGDGTIREQRDVVASSGRYSISVRLPELAPDTVVRAQVTWLGSTTSPGGTSPVLVLPVGGYSAVPSQGQEAPEQAVFVMGQSPTGATGDELQGIMDKAVETFLADFGAERDFPDRHDDILDTLAAGDGNILLLYALADIDGESLLLADGGEITVAELADRTHDLDEGTRSIVIVEGPKSGIVAEQAGAFREGTTLVTSCDQNQGNIRLSPKETSFSWRFFLKCGEGKSVDVAFSSAKDAFSRGGFGALQSPQLIRGSLAQEQLSGKFVIAELPDLDPPEIVRVAWSIGSGAEPEIHVAVEAADNRSDAGVLRITAEPAVVQGQAPSPVVLTPPADASGLHRVALPGVDPPGVAVALVASDRAGNTSDPVVVWIPVAVGARAYDLDGDGRVDDGDLRTLLPMDESGYLAGNWQLGFSRQWMRNPD